MLSNPKCPLIGLVLWTDNELNEVNYNIKNILKLYVNYIGIDFPVQHIKILGVSARFSDYNRIKKHKHLIDTKLLCKLNIFAFIFCQQLVNLIYNIFELREIRMKSTKIDYPQSVQNHSQFCDAFTKIIFGQQIESFFFNA